MDRWGWEGTINDAVYGPYYSVFSVSNQCCAYNLPHSINDLAAYKRAR